MSVERKEAWSADDMRRSEVVAVEPVPEGLTDPFGTDDSRLGQTGERLADTRNRVSIGKRLDLRRRKPRLRRGEYLKHVAVYRRGHDGEWVGRSIRSIVHLQRE